MYDIFLYMQRAFIQKFISEIPVILVFLCQIACLMRNRFFAALGFVLILYSCSGNVKSDLDTYGLTCKVKEMTVAVSEGELDYTVFFNRLGQIDSLVRYGIEDDIMDKEIYSYDKSHHRIKISNIDSDGQQEGWYEYEYDGDFVSVCEYYGMNSNVLYRWEHLNDGRNIIETRCYMEGELQFIDCKDYNGLSYEERQMDAEGNEVGTAHVDLYAPEKPSLVVQEGSQIRIDYNENGLPEHSSGVLISSNSDFGWHPSLEEKPERWYKYEYDKKGNWVLRTTHDSPDGEALITVRRTIIY